MRRRHDYSTGTTITELTYQGRTVDLQINDKGIFYALIAEDRIEAKSLDALKDRVKKAIDALGKIEIPVTLISTSYDDPPTLTDALLLRLRRNVAVVRDDEGREDVLSYNQDLLRRLSEPEQAALIDAWRTYKAAEATYNAIIEEAQRNAPDLLAEAAGARTPILKPAQED